VRTALASSAGVQRSDAVTDAHVKVVARDERRRSGYAAAIAVALDPGAVAVANVDAGFRVTASS
jgi:hypothetical protein